MTREDEKYYEDYFDLFASTGWKQFVEQAEESASRFTIEALSNESELNHAKGQLYILNNIVNFETTIRNAYDSVMSESPDD